MEFGALQCVPVSPDCVNCPLNHCCKAYQENVASQLPVKIHKTKVTHRFFYYLFIENEGNTYLQKRTAKDVWQNLYEFPLIETEQLLTLEELILTPGFIEIFDNTVEVDILKESGLMKHVLSHRIIFARFITLRVKSKNDALVNFIEVPLSEIDRFPVSRLMEIFLETM